MDTDYTTQQPREGTAQDAFDRELGEGRVQAGAMFEAVNCEEMSVVRRIAYSYGVRVVTDKPGQTEIGLGVKKLKGPMEIDSVSGTVKVGAGVTFKALATYLAAEGLELERAHPGPASQCIGPGVAMGQCADSVASIGAVLPDGTVFQTPLAPRSATGPSTLALMQNGQNAIAVTAWVVLRVQPKPVSTVTLAHMGPVLPMLEQVRLAFRMGVRPHCVTGIVESGDSLRVQWTFLQSSEAAQMQAHFQSKDGVAEVKFKLLRVPGGGRTRLSWSQLENALAARGRRKPFLGPFDVYGAWISTPRPPQADPLLNSIRHELDPTSR